MRIELEKLPGNNLPLVQGGETDSLQQLEQVVHVLGLLKDQPLLHFPSSIRIKKYIYNKWMDCDSVISN
jgi:hypothetical protein